VEFLILIIVVCIICSVWSDWDTKKKKIQREDLRESSSVLIGAKLEDAKHHNFNPTQTLWSLENDRLLGLDENIKKIGYFTENNYKLYSYRDILRSEILIDGVQVTRTSRSSQLGGAILGGILAGGVGAIIGGLSASQETTNEIKRVDLNIIVNDTSSPQLAITLIKPESGIIEARNKTYKDEASHWHNLISVLIHQADLEDEKNETIPISHPTSSGTQSLADEIEKLASLMEKGLITKEEFEKQKANLIR
jgi:hypothetical protein